MDDILIINLVWLAFGAIAIYFIDKRSYNEGLVDAIVMHSRGKLTYFFFEGDDGVEKIEIKVAKNED